MSKLEAIRESIYIHHVLTVVMMLVIAIIISHQIKGLNVEVPPVEVPDYSQSLETLEGQIDFLKQRMEELEARLQDIQDGLEDLLETFDVAGTYTITGYAPLDPSAVYGLDYIGDPTITASGDRPIPGQTVAAAKDIPFGTRVWIEGIGLRTVNDRGGAIKRRRLDLCMATRDEAIAFGRQTKKVIILKEGQK